VGVKSAAHFGGLRALLRYDDLATALSRITLTER
jgi:hypothetical protein